MKTQKQRATTMMIAMIVIIFVVVLITHAVLEKKGSKKKTANQFAKCKVLANSCKDQDCKFLFLCNEKDFSDCKVYDCGDNYGVRITGKAGKIREEIREKTSPCNNKETQEMIAKCSGTFEVIEKNNCENGEAIAKVKLNMKGDCKIVSATMAINDKMRIAGVEQNGEFYNISVKSCGEISDIKITGEGGVVINEGMEASEEGMTGEDMMEERFLPERFEGMEK